MHENEKFLSVFNLYNLYLIKIKDLYNFYKDGFRNTFIVFDINEMFGMEQQFIFRWTDLDLSKYKIYNSNISITQQHMNVAAVFGIHPTDEMVQHPSVASAPSPFAVSVPSPSTISTRSLPPTSRAPAGAPTSGDPRSSVKRKANPEVGPPEKNGYRQCIKWKSTKSTCIK